MKKNMGIITVLVGVGLLFISIFFSSGQLGVNISSKSKKGGYSTGYGNAWHGTIEVETNFISQGKIILKKGKYVTGQYKNHYEGGDYIPLKYPLSLSVVLILFGTGLLLVSRNKCINHL